MYRGEVSNWSWSWPITALEAGQDTLGNTRGEDEDIRAPWDTGKTEDNSDADKTPGYEQQPITWQKPSSSLQGSEHYTDLPGPLLSHLEVGKGAVLLVSKGPAVHGEVLDAHLVTRRGEED